MSFQKYPPGGLLVVHDDGFLRTLRFSMTSCFFVVSLGHDFMMVDRAVAFYDVPCSVAGRIFALHECCQRVKRLVKHREEKVGDILSPSCVVLIASAFCTRACVRVYVHVHACVRV